MPDNSKDTNGTGKPELPGSTNTSLGGLLREIEISKEIAKYDTLRAFFWSTPISIGLALLANRYSPTFQRLRTPYKLGATLLIPVTYTAWRLDYNAIVAGKRIARIMQDLGGNVNDVTIQSILEETTEQSHLSNTLRSNFGKIILGTWLTAVGGSLLYNWRRKDISTGLKIVNARVTAQVAALSGLALVSYYIPTSRKDKHDTENGQNVNDDNSN